MKRRANVSSQSAATSYDSLTAGGASLPCRTLGQLKGDDVPLRKAVGTPRMTCWCERRVLAVTWDEIAEGVTRSCGTPRCDAIGIAAGHVA